MPPFNFDEFSAHAAMLGYLYQVRYALWMALLVDDADAQEMGITLERTDDVALTTEEQVSEAVQTKYHLASGALTDGSADLWKTLRVWSEAIKGGKLTVPGTLLTLVTTQTAPQGSAPFLLRPAQDTRDEKQALALLRQVAATSSSASLRSAFAAFQELSETQQGELVRAVRVLDRSPMVNGLQKKLEKEIRAAVPPAYRTAALQDLEGWWGHQVYLHLQAPGHDVIPVRAVMDQIHDLRRRFSETSLPIYTLHEIPFDQFLGANERHLFLKQLRLIQLKDRGLTNAVTDFFRATQLRGRWVREQLLFIDELKRYDGELEREWDRHFDDAFDTEDSSNLDEATKAVRARQLLRTIEGLSLHIRRDCSDLSIMRGSFHWLADRGKVGWHPEFLSRLKSEITMRTGT